MAILKCYVVFKWSSKQNWKTESKVSNLFVRKFCGSDLPLWHMIMHCYRLTSSKPCGWQALGLILIVFLMIFADLNESTPSYTRIISKWLILYTNLKGFLQGLTLQMMIIKGMEIIELWSLVTLKKKTKCVVHDKRVHREHWILK